MQTEALNAHLKPLKSFLEDPLVSEIIVNKPYEVYVEKAGSFSRLENKSLNLSHLKRLASLIANYNKKPLCEAHPRLSARLPQGHRVQIITPPMVEEGVLALSIRKQVIADIRLTDLRDDFWSACSFETITRKNQSLIHKQTIGLDARDVLVSAIKQKRTILIAGGTSTGKTTFLNACLKHIPLHERLIILEDTREVHPTQPNHLCLIAGSLGDNHQKKDMDDNLKASLRLRPDRIIVGELRGEEAATFLDAASTGHEGSFATIHATNPNLAIERLAGMCEKAGLVQLSRESLRHHIVQVIDMVVQLKRDSHGRRFISDIWSFE